MRASLAGFEAWLAGKGLAATTVELYRLAAQPAARASSPIAAFGPATGLSASRRSTIRKALLQWASFTSDSHLEAALRIASVPGATDREAPPVTLDGPAWLAFVAEVDRLRQNEPAMWATCRLVATTGLRVGEVLGMTRDELRLGLESRSVSIRQKGGTRRLFVILEIHADPLRVLAAQLDLEELPEVWRLFGEERRPAYMKVWRAIKTIGRRAGVPEAHPHAFRRTVADAVYDSTNDLRAVQTVLGHKRLATTMHSYQDHPRVSPTRKSLEAGLAALGKETPHEHD